MSEYDDNNNNYYNNDEDDGHADAGFEDGYDYRGNQDDQEYDGDRFEDDCHGRSGYQDGAEGFEGFDQGLGDEGAYPEGEVGDEYYEEGLEDDRTGGKEFEREERYNEDEGHIDGGHRGDYYDGGQVENEDNRFGYDQESNDGPRDEYRYNGLNDHRQGDGYGAYAYAQGLQQQENPTEQEPYEEETYDERIGYVQDRGGYDEEQAEPEQGIDEGDDEAAELYVPPQHRDLDRDQYDDEEGRGYQKFETEDTIGGYNSHNDDVRYSPREDQHDSQRYDEEYDPEQHDDRSHGRDDRSEDSDGYVGEGIKGNNVGYDEEYEFMEESYRQGPAEYGGGDTVNDDDEDYSNTLYRPPRVRAQMRRDREASKRRSTQQRGRGPDAEERKHD